MSGVVSINSGDEGDLQSAVANVGPVSTYVDASHSSFQVRSTSQMKTNLPNSSPSLSSSTVEESWIFLTAHAASWPTPWPSLGMVVDAARTTGYWRTGMREIKRWEKSKFYELFEPMLSHFFPSFPYNFFHTHTFSLSLLLLLCLKLGT